MALIDLIDNYNLGTSASYTDAAGNTAELTITNAANNLAAGTSYDTALGSDGLGVVGPAASTGNGVIAEWDKPVEGFVVQVAALQSGDRASFVIDGQSVTLSEMQNDLGVTIDFGGMQEISGLLGPNSDGDGTRVATFTFNEPIQTFQMNTATNNTGSGANIVFDMYVDDTIAAMCFVAGTNITTDKGEVAVEDLREGMMVKTQHNGYQPIRWIGSHTEVGLAHYAPICIKAGAMGNTRDLIVSPGHRMVLEGWQVEMLFDHKEALVTAAELVNDTTVLRQPMKKVEYFHVMFDQHEVIYAEGAATESFHPDQPSMGSMDAAARTEILALFPELENGGTRAEAAPSLSPSQAAYIGDNLDVLWGTV